jgi:hypothetical protein
MIHGFIWYNGGDMSVHICETHRMNKIKMEVQGNYRWGENDMSMEVCD